MCTYTTGWYCMQFGFCLFSWYVLLSWITFISLTLPFVRFFVCCWTSSGGPVNIVSAVFRGRRLPGRWTVDQHGGAGVYQHASSTSGLHRPPLLPPKQFISRS
eukprot:GHVT01066136.1.p2 GENE.GHVT01066136.1~~GHVT01066136.1.p2  ORF type:complete len:103 (+),score=2.03 GHVT01066136.1:1754-2062(+)